MICWFAAWSSLSSRSCEHSGRQGCPCGPRRDAAAGLAGLCAFLAGWPAHFFAVGTLPRSTTLAPLPSSSPAASSVPPLSASAFAKPPWRRLSCTRWSSKDHPTASTLWNAWAACWSFSAALALRICVACILGAADAQCATFLKVPRKKQKGRYRRPACRPVRAWPLRSLR